MPYELLERLSEVSTVSRLSEVSRVVRGAVSVTGASATAGASAREIKIASSKRLSARLTDFTLTTAAFDFHPHVRVLLPSRYGAHPRRRYPVSLLECITIDK